MKKFKVLLVSSVLCAGCSFSALAQVAAVVEPGAGFTAAISTSIANQISQWMTAIDTLYSNYDQVMNTITMIEQNYETIKKATERMKNIDWENIQWDGDFDIRNDIKNANARVNRFLTQARKIEETITRGNIPIGNNVYSIADLCGASKDGKRNIASAFKDYIEFYEENFKSIGNALAGELSQKQRIAIMQKYGISPANFLMVQKSEAAVRDGIAKAMGKVKEEARQLMDMEKEKEVSAIMEGAFSSIDADGNITQGATNEALLRLIDVLIARIDRLDKEMQDANKLQADIQSTKIALNETEKKAADTARENEKAMNSRMSDSFHVSSQNNRR